MYRLNPKSCIFIFIKEKVAFYLTRKKDDVLKALGIFIFAYSHFSYFVITLSCFLDLLIIKNKHLVTFCFSFDIPDKGYLCFCNFLRIIFQEE